MVASVAGLLDAVVSWAGDRPSVRGVALVGSYARGDARPDSDVDLMLLVTRPGDLLRAPVWLGDFGRVVSVVEEDWGEVTSLRVVYEHGLEVEFGLTTPAWARLPVDVGTRRVVEDGLAVLYDPDGGLERLEGAVAG